jgi:hypothetical protein
MSNEISVKSMVTMGRCQVCGKPIKVSARVAQSLDRQGLEVTTCSRAHADILAGVESGEESEGEDEI